MGLRRTSLSCLRPRDHVLLRPHQRINQINGIRDILWTKNAFCDTINEVSRCRHMLFLLQCLPAATQLNAIAPVWQPGQQSPGNSLATG